VFNLEVAVNHICRLLVSTIIIYFLVSASINNPIEATQPTARVYSSNRFVCVCFISFWLACSREGDFDDHSSINVSATHLPLSRNLIQFRCVDQHFTDIILAVIFICFYYFYNYQTKVVSGVFSRGLSSISFTEYYGSRVALPSAVYVF